MHLAGPSNLGDEPYQDAGTGAVHHITDFTLQSMFCVLLQHGNDVMIMQAHAMRQMRLYTTQHIICSALLKQMRCCNTGQAHVTGTNLIGYL